LAVGSSRARWPAKLARRLTFQDKAYTRNGPGGLVGYCLHLAKHNEAVFAPLLGRVLPMHLAPAVVTNNKFKTESEVRELCRAHGLPFASVLDLSQPAPRSMIDVTPVRKTR
jgi:hypothetical protein